MSRPFPLKPLLDLTQTRLDDAAKTLGELVAKETEHSQKLQLLEEYRQDYFQRFEQAALDGISPDMWRNYSAFIARIDEAIAVQQDVLARARQNTAAGKQEWVGHRNRLKAYSTLEDQHLQRENRRELRAEQKQLDEHTATLLRRKQESGVEE